MYKRDVPKRGQSGRGRKIFASETVLSEVRYRYLSEEDLASHSAEAGSHARPATEVHPSGLYSAGAPSLGLILHTSEDELFRGQSYWYSEFAAR